MALKRKSLFVLSVITLVGVLFLGACAKENSAGADSSQSNAGTPSSLGSSGPSADQLKGLNARDALVIANNWGTAKKDAVTSHVTAEKVFFEFSNGKKANIRLPDEKMVVAIAPWVTYTHPCETHYISGCQGELTDTPVKVFGQTADGLVVIDSTYTTMKNGFIELWLPRNLEINLSLEAQGKKASGRISTFRKSNTCVTTFQLL